MELGTLTLPSGKIFASDPRMISIDGAASCYVRSVKPGTYPVEACLIESFNRYACVAIRFTNETPVYWRMALRPGQSVDDLAPGEVFGVSVDSGTVGFGDAELLRQFSTPSFSELVDAALSTSDPNGVVVDAESNTNVIWLSSGQGDGAYPAFWGVSANGDVCCLAMDFYLLGASVKETVFVSLESALAGQVRVRIGDEEFDVSADTDWDTSSPMEDILTEVAPFLVSDGLDEEMKNQLLQSVIDMQEQFKKMAEVPPEGMYCCVNAPNGVAVAVVSAGKTYKFEQKSSTRSTFRCDEVLLPEAMLKLTMATRWQSFECLGVGEH
ncbi:MAG: DUF4241 domain-containing protein [Planctomycetaceae bacterium]